MPILAELHGKDGRGEFIGVDVAAGWDGFLLLGVHVFQWKKGRRNGYLRAAFLCFAVCGNRRRHVPDAGNRLERTTLF